MKNKILKRHLFVKNINIFFVLLICFYLISFFADCAEIARKCSVESIQYNINFLKISFYRSFNILTEIIPYLLLISNSMIFSKLNSTEELTILKTNGFSIFQIAQPFIIFAIIIGTMNLFIMHPFSTYAIKKTIILEHKALGESLDKNESKSNIWVEQSDYKINTNLLIYVQSINKNELNNINIYFMDKNNHSFKSHIFAKKAKIKNGHWILFNGGETLQKLSTNKFEKKIFKTNLTEKDMNLYYKNPLMLNFIEMYNILKLRKSKNLPYNMYAFSLNFLFVKIMLCLITALFPIIFFFKHHRYSSKWFNVFCIISFAFLLNFFINSIRSIGLNCDLAPIITCWSPVLILLSIVIFCVRKIESST